MQQIDGFHLFRNANFREQKKTIPKQEPFTERVSSFLMRFLPKRKNLRFRTTVFRKQRVSKPPDHKKGLSVTVF